jgi:hypothetical protein
MRQQNFTKKSYILRWRYIVFCLKNSSIMKFNIKWDNFFTTMQYIQVIVVKKLLNHVKKKYCYWTCNVVLEEFLDFLRDVVKLCNVKPEQNKTNMKKISLILVLNKFVLVLKKMVMYFKETFLPTGIKYQQSLWVLFKNLKVNFLIKI